MAEQQGFPFDPAVHHQPPPRLPDGLASAARPASPPVPSSRSPEAAQWTQQQIDAMIPPYVKMARAAAGIAATRVLLLLVVLTASIIWGITTWQPTELRIIACAVYSALVGWPLVWLYFRVR